MPVERLPYLVSRAIECLAASNRSSWSAPSRRSLFRLSRQAQSLRSRRLPVQFIWRIPHEDGAGALGVGRSARRTGAIAATRAFVAPRHTERQPRCRRRDRHRPAATTTPEGAILVDEAIFRDRRCCKRWPPARPHMHLAVAGGSAGTRHAGSRRRPIWPRDRKVVCALGDGSAAYIHTGVVDDGAKISMLTVIFCQSRLRNSQFRIAACRGVSAGSAAYRCFDLGRPQIDWVNIAQGWASEASRATICASADQYRSAMQQRAPRLIEAIIYREGRKRTKISSVDLRAMLGADGSARYDGWLAWRRAFGEADQLLGAGIGATAQHRGSAAVLR